eukprot:jgi/Chrzof1/13366/Cz07g30110.t1_ELIP2[v5.2]
MQTICHKQCAAATWFGCPRSSKARLGSARLICKAELETARTPAERGSTSTVSTNNSTSAAISQLPVPEWLPKEVTPILGFLNATDFKLQESSFYREKLREYVENEWVQKSTGFKTLPETINGRAAMLGFVAGAAAEIFGAGPILGQLSRSPQPVLVIIALIMAGSIIPIYKGTKGEYLDSLQDTYTLPEGVFTEPNERVHGRLAMLGLGALIVIELIKGSALL